MCWSRERTVSCSGHLNCQKARLDLIWYGNKKSGVYFPVEGCVLVRQRLQGLYECVSVSARGATGVHRHCFPGVQAISQEMGARWEQDYDPFGPQINVCIITIPIGRSWSLCVWMGSAIDARAVKYDTGQVQTMRSCCFVVTMIVIVQMQAVC